jgi:hypothetical protein
MRDPAPPARSVDSIDWSQTTHEGNRRRQHLEFLALSLREKILRIEQMCEVSARLIRRRESGGEPARGDGDKGAEGT